MKRKRTITDEMRIALDAALKDPTNLTERQIEIIEEMKPRQLRPCGACTMCCRAPTIDETLIKAGDVMEPKPHGVTCQYCNLKSGCNRYETRPSTCKGYECLWGLGMIPEEHFPETVGVCWTLQPTQDESGLIVMGHCFDVGAVLHHELTPNLVNHFFSNDMISAVTLRSDKEVVALLPSGIIAHAEIDQDDPMRMRVDASTEHLSRFSIE